MRVTVSVFGRFHAFYLARQLYRKGYLYRLITSYPKFETVKYGIPRDKIISLFPMELIRRAWKKFPSVLKDHYNAQYFLSNAYDRLAAKFIPPDTDIFIGWSSFSLHSLRHAKRFGAMTILERGSSHILYQQQILKEEFEKYGITRQIIHPKIIGKELCEYEKTDYIEIPSSYVYRTFIERGIPPCKLIKGFRGVDLTQFRQIKKEDNVFRIIHCGGITLQKGVHYLLQAFYELNLPNAELWLIGAMSQEIQPFCRKFDNGKVFHKGPYRQDQLYHYYSQGSVFCLASIQEGLAVVQLQAMACGLPVICTQNTGGEDVIRDKIDGFVIPIRDLKALKEKILYFYEHRDACRQMGENAKKRVSRDFTWDDYGDAIIRQYENLYR